MRPRSKSISQPWPVGVEQDVVGVEVGVVEAGAMEARDQAAGLLPRRAVAGDRGAVGERTHAVEALDQDRGAVAHALAPVAGGDRLAAPAGRVACSARVRRNSAKLRTRSAPCHR